MIYKNVRQLLHDFNSTISELPVTITRNGIPICVITGIDQVEPIKEPPTLKELQEEINGIESGVQETATVPSRVMKPQNCEIPGCKNEAVEDGEMYNESTGEMVPVRLCQRHYTAYLRETGGGS